MEKDIPFELAISKKADKKFFKLQKKNPQQFDIIEKKIAQILKNPYHFKPLRGDLFGARRTHIDSSFVLIFEILENERTVNILDFDHHDNIY